jgi:DNA polymerase-3 subunit delta'
MYFKDVIGHASVKRLLTKMVNDDHVGHALMFTGPDGSGNLPLAIAFAGYIFCENPSDGDRCGNCSACKKMDALGHPDLHFSFPIVKQKKADTSSTFLRSFITEVKSSPYLTLKGWELASGGEKKKSLIATNESEEIIRSLSLKSFDGGYKILIIWHADKLHRSAANKLLKTLEEPSHKTIVILVCESSEDILPTIVSRTQRVNCGKLNDGTIAEALVNNFGKNPEEAEKIARLSRGNYYAAMEMAKNGVVSSEYFELFKNWMRACAAGRYDKIIESAEQISTLSRDGQQYFLEYCLEFLHQCLIYKLLGEDKVRLDDEAKAFAEGFVPVITGTNMAGFEKVFSQSHYLVGRNAYSALLYSKMGQDLAILFAERKPEFIS